MEKEDPAESVYSLIKHAVVLNAFNQLKIREVPHAPEAGRRTAQVKDEE